MLMYTVVEINKSIIKWLWWRASWRLDWLLKIKGQTKNNYKNQKSSEVHKSMRGLKIEKKKFKGFVRHY